MTPHSNPKYTPDNLRAGRCNNGRGGQPGYPTYRCGRMLGHGGNHHDYLLRHTWA